MAKAYSYIVAREYIFAPNPFFGVLTLATCKPGIRYSAEIGDFIIGNANGDAKVTASSVDGSGVAGSYDPEEKMITLNLLHAVPGLGSFGTYPDYILISE